MTVELDRDDLVNLIIGCSGPYYTIMEWETFDGICLFFHFLIVWSKLIL